MELTVGLLCPPGTLKDSRIGCIAREIVRLSDPRSENYQDLRREGPWYLGDAGGHHRAGGTWTGRSVHLEGREEAFIRVFHHHLLPVC